MAINFSRPDLYILSKFVNTHYVCFNPEEIISHFNMYSPSLYYR